MRSQEIFERPARAARPRRPVGPIAVLSLILPGSGHVLLGRVRTGFTLLGVALLTVPAAVVVRGLLPEVVAPLAWGLGRLGILAALFAMIDAPLLARQARSADAGRTTLPPREAAGWNAAFYGAGFLKLDERANGWLAVVFGGLAHVGLVLWLPPTLTVLAELVPLALALGGYRLAEEIAGRRDRVLAEDDSLGLRRPVAPLPAWLPPAQAFMVGLVTLTAVGTWIAHAAWLDTRTVDRREAIAQEPFYRNPTYGLQLEMRTPGWTFRQDDPSLFVDAIHIGARSRLQVRLMPRIPGRDGLALAEAAFTESLAASGLSVRSVTAEAFDRGSVRAIRLRGQAVRDGRARDVAGLCTEQGFRRYLLHMEWDADDAGFGVAEWDFVLNGLTIEDRRLGTAVVAR